jgi:hypothetical protein
MSIDGEERARRAEQAYERQQQVAQEHAGELAVQASAVEHQRISGSARLFSAALDAALERLDKANYPGLEELEPAFDTRVATAAKAAVTTAKVLVLQRHLEG